MNRKNGKVIKNKAINGKAINSEAKNGGTDREQGKIWGSMRIWRLGLSAAVMALMLSGCTGKAYERIAVPAAYETETGGNGAGQEFSESGAAALEEDSLPAAELVIVPEEAPGTSDGSGAETDGSEGGTAAGTGTGQNGGSGQKITLLFGGDVLLSDHVLQAYDKAGGISGVLDEGYLQAAGEADFFMVNQEFPFSSRGTQAPDKQFTFRLAPERVEIFSQIGIDGVTLANNHALDFGEDALLDSCSVLDGVGILHTGAGNNLDEAKQPVIVERNGKRIAVIGATRVIPVADWAAGSHHAGMLATYDPSVLLEEISRLKQENDYVIVYVHWGIEKEETPQEYQRTLGKQYMDAGADLVIGAHPHVLQGIEYYQGKPIVYSLGNFIFGSSIPRTALLEVTIEAGEQESGQEDKQEEEQESEQAKEKMKLRLLPGTSGAGYTHMLTNEEKRQEFFRYMEEISFGAAVLEDGMVVPDQDGAEQ